MVKMLGQAMLLMERSWNSLSEEDLKQLVKCVEGARLLRFKVDCLEPVAAKAERLLKYYAAKRRHDDLKAKIKEIQREVEATQSEMNAALGDEDLESIVGVDCQV